MNISKTFFLLSIILSFTVLAGNTSVAGIPSSLPWCNQVKAEWLTADGAIDRTHHITGSRLSGDILTGTIILMCKFPGRGKGPYKERSKKYLSDLINTLKTEHLKQVLDDGGESNYTDDDGQTLANKFIQGPIQEENWMYADFFRLGIIVKEDNHRVLFDDGGPVIKELSANSSIVIPSRMWREGALMYRIDSRSFNEDDEELKMRNAHYLVAGEDFFAHTSISEGVYLDGSPHQYLKSIVSEYRTTPLDEVDSAGKWAHYLTLKTTVKAHYTGDAERHRTPAEFEEAVMKNFDQTVKRRVAQLVPSLVDHF